MRIPGSGVVLGRNALAEARRVASSGGASEVIQEVYDQVVRDKAAHNTFTKGVKALPNAGERDAILNAMSAWHINSKQIYADLVGKLTTKVGSIAQSTHEIQIAMHSHAVEKFGDVHDNMHEAGQANLQHLGKTMKSAA